MATNTVNSTRIETLTKDNYDTWKIQAEALLVNNDLWEYVSGETPRPEPAAENAAADAKAAADAAIREWTRRDRKARSNLMLSISPSELVDVNHCPTSKGVWDQLENSFASKGPARKATLLKQISNSKLRDGDDVRSHLMSFFGAVDKLKSMGVDMNGDLLAILLLNTLPETYDYFRCAIESRDTLPPADHLRIKIVEESEARKQKLENNSNGALFARQQSSKHQVQGKQHNNSNNKPRPNQDKKSQSRCSYCKYKGHEVEVCRKKKRDDSQKGKLTQDDVYFADARTSDHSTQAVAISRKWCLDSGATSHLCNDDSLFVNTQRVNSGLRLASSATTAIDAMGDVKISTRVGKSDKSITLRETYHVPDLRTNLMSVAKLVDKGNTVTFTRHGAKVVDGNGNLKIQAKRIGNLFYLNQDPQVANAATDITSPLTKWHRRLGHLNYGDLKTLINQGYIREPNVDTKGPVPSCETCIAGKFTCLPFPQRTETATKPLQIVHTDLCGKMRTQSQRGALYLLTFTDEYTRWTDVYFLRSKDQVHEVFPEYKTRIENQTGHKIKYLQSDNGGEFCNARMDEILRKSGIQRRLTTPHTPQQNGIAERKNRTLVEMARCMLLESGLPPSLWAEAIAAANHVRNRCPTRSLDGKTPYEKLTGRRPNLSYLQSFGSKAFVLDKQPGKGKFDSRTQQGRLVGYSDTSKAYRIWIPGERSIQVSRDVRFVDELNSSNEPSDIVDENTLIGRTRVADITGDTAPLGTTIIGTREREDHVAEKTTRPPASTRARAIIDVNDQGQRPPGQAQVHEERPPARKRAAGRPAKQKTGRPGRPKKIYHYKDEEEQSRDARSQSPDQHNEDQISDDDDTEQGFKGFEHPTYSGQEQPDCCIMHCEDDSQWHDIEFAFSCSEIPLSEAISGPEQEEWKKAIAAETRSMLENNAWEIVDRPTDRKVIGSRTVLRNKYRSDGTLERRKARIVAKGFNQIPGIDFYESYSPVGRLSSLRLLFALSAKHHLAVTQLDVTTAYLYGDIDTETYMDLPELLLDSLDIISKMDPDPLIRDKAAKMLAKVRKGNQACRLIRAIYGLKQAGRQWHSTLTSTFKEAGLRPTHSDPCLFTDESKRIFVLVYVDDLLIATKDKKLEKHPIALLSQRFKIKNLGQPSYCLGIEIKKSRESIHLSQANYIRDILERFGMSDCKPVSTPMSTSTDLRVTSGEDEPAEKRPFRELVGSLMYLAIGTRPDIAHAVSAISQFNQNHSSIHWNAAKRVLRYLKGTINQGLLYKADDHAIRGFVDADWANCPIDRRSYTGYSFLLAGAAVTWESRKQTTVALSSTEAEYLGLSAAAKEAIYLINFVRELGFDSLAKVELFNDNTSAIKLSKNPVFHSRTKHISVRDHFIRQALKQNPINLSHISTDFMFADFLTKRLPAPKHEFCCRGLGILPVYSNATR